MKERTEISYHKYLELAEVCVNVYKIQFYMNWWNNNVQVYKQTKMTIRLLEKRLHCNYTIHSLAAQDLPALLHSLQTYGRGSLSNVPSFLHIFTCAHTIFPFSIKQLVCKSEMETF